MVRGGARVRFLGGAHLPLDRHPNPIPHPSLQPSPQPSLQPSLHPLLQPLLQPLPQPLPLYDVFGIQPLPPRCGGTVEDGRGDGAEVAQLAVATTVLEHILELEVAVRHRGLLTVHVRHALARVHEAPQHARLTQPPRSRLDVLGQGAAAAQLDGEEVLVAAARWLLAASIEADDVGVGRQRAEEEELRLPVSKARTERVSSRSVSPGLISLGFKPGVAYAISAEARSWARTFFTATFSPLAASRAR